MTAYANFQVFQTLLSSFVSRKRLIGAYQLIWGRTANSKLKIRKFPNQQEKHTRSKQTFSQEFSFILNFIRQNYLTIYADSVMDVLVSWLISNSRSCRSKTYDAGVRWGWQQTTPRIRRHRYCTRSNTGSQS